jgi:thiol-disulfide isomerase/thioredoxin
MRDARKGNVLSMRVFDMNRLASWIGTAALISGVAAIASASADEGRMPDLGGAVGWINSAPLNSKSLRGKVVLLDFWTYTCINSLRPLPYVKSWAAKYKDAGLVVIGVHTPEFSFEHERRNVENAVREFKITYPVAVDSNYGVWRAFENEYWPAQYLIDGKGRISYRHAGEGDYAAIEHVIQQLIHANQPAGADASAVKVSGVGLEAAPDMDSELSSETYVGYRQAERFASPERVSKNKPKMYSPPVSLSLNQWGLSGSWNVGAESAVLQAPSGKIVFRFHSRDLHMVLGPTKERKPIRFRVMLNGKPPGNNSGTDSTPDGAGDVREPRLYQLIRQKGEVKDSTFEIEFLDPGLHAVVFTFG